MLFRFLFYRMANNDLTKLQKDIGYAFSDEKLLKTALIHASADVGEDYERLEFLGDAVLELVISELMFEKKPDCSEGDLTKSRAALVNEGTLAQAARELELAGHLVLGRGERMSGGAEKPSILADVIEALIGAVYLDGGYGPAKKLALALLEDSIEEVLSGGGIFDYKTRLQEYFHKLGTSDIHYIVYKEQGPPHDRGFFCQADRGRP